MKQLAALREYNAQLEKLIDGQKKEMVSIRQQIDDVTNVDRTIMPLMFRMIDALDQFVKLDVPFLSDERRARVANLRAMDRSEPIRPRNIVKFSKPMKLKMSMAAPLKPMRTKWT